MPRPTVKLSFALSELAEDYSRVLPDVSFVVLPTTNTLASLQALQEGSVDLSLSSADLAYPAFYGAHAHVEGHFDRVRAIAVLRQLPVHVLVRPGVGITSLAHLRGRRVALGLANSSTALTAKLLLAAFGLTPRDFTPVFVSLAEGSERLVAGDVDVAFARVAAPADPVTFALARGMQLLNVEGHQIAGLRRVYPFLKLTRIPAGVYQGYDRSTRTVGVDALLACRAGLSEELVFRLTKALFRDGPAGTARLDQLRSVEFDRAPATLVPLHPGAARYYRERELYQ